MNISTTTLRPCSHDVEHHTEHRLQINDETMVVPLDAEGKEIMTTETSEGIKGKRHLNPNCVGAIHQIFMDFFST